MCLAVEEMVIESAILVFKKLNMSQEEAVQYVMKEYQKREEEAEELIRQNWQ